MRYPAFIAAIAAVIAAGTALLLGGCVGSPARIESRALAGQLGQSPEHYIVAAVENDRSAFVGHAASTPRGYDGVGAYGPTPHALNVMQSIESDYRLREVKSWPIAPLHMHCAILEIAADADRGALLAALGHDPRIRLAEPLQVFATRTEYNDPYVGLQRGFQQMDVADAHPISNGAGVRIAIVDTGADNSHPDLRGAIIQSVNFVDHDDGQFRRDRHGTEIAGIIAAIANNHEGIVGVAPGARLSIFKACWQLEADADAARCNSFTLSQAMVAAFDAHAQIINLSLSGPADPLLRALMTEGLRRGIVFVGAAPADIDSSDVAFMRQDGVILADSAELPVAGPGSAMRLSAPGREILTSLPGGHYDFASGSSLATAHVTGAVALLLAKDPQLSQARIYQLLHDTAAPASADSNAGHGINACAALVTLTGHGACRTLASDNRVAVR